MKTTGNPTWLITSSLCVGVVLSVFTSVAVAGIHHLVEEISVELVEFEECEEAISDRRERRATKRESSHSQLSDKNPKLANDRRTPKVFWERENFNGTGSYLIT